MESIIVHPELQEAVTQPQNRPMWNLIWGGVSSFIVIVLTVLGFVLKWNWGKLMQTVDSKASAADLKELAIVVDKKAFKDDIDEKHQQNMGRLNEILANQRGSDEKREKLLEMIGLMASDVAVLKDRAGMRRLP